MSPSLKSLTLQINHLHPLNEADMYEILGLCSVQQFRRGDDVQSIGHTCRTLYFVGKGALRIYYYKDTTDITESFEFENAFVARAESLFSGMPSRKAIQAIEDSELVAINSVKLFQLFESHHPVETFFRKLIEKSYVRMVNRLESLQFHTAAERYMELIREQPDVVKRVPLKMIASYLGITPESLSRIRAAK